MPNPSRVLLLCCVVVLLAAGWVQAQTPPPSDYVTREEYDRLKQAFDSLQAEVSAIKEQAPAVAAPAAKAADAEEATETQDRFDALEQEMKELKDLSDLSSPGQTKFLVTGYGFAGFTDREGSNSNFSTGFNPIFLWQPTERILFEGELEVEVEGSGETVVALEYANMSYLLNDYVTIGGGKFITPLGIFNARLHPKWINKLPDRPLPYAHGGIGLVPDSELGFYVSGGIPIEPTKLNYAVYVSNGPALITDDPDAAGKLDFDNFTDINNSKAVGGRIGFLPIPEVEVGYSAQFAKINPADFETVYTLIQGVDLSYVRELACISGTLDARVEWVFSNVDDATFDPTGALGFGPLTFNNDRNAGYVQLAYRPTLVGNKILKNTEFVIRYDMLEVPSGAPDSFDEQRWTLGIDYWLTSSFVIKAAYEFDNLRGAEDRNAFFIQAALGF